ncbi:conjugal transfer protein [Cytobacillus sp. Sa5YUA1]|uniref:Conjugal transfer protein n=1 Tax=Cytobacillus stercorigallinarum TaxID=2762240 RepID=A0ABR8QVT1_9BACI|nr:conjugal transfer protein [Cytobacillus stercorigallinarum]MBD7939645.1 conjugal transfer protein [Cytobacillus stercorigallinarum]
MKVKLSKEEKKALRNQKMAAFKHRISNLRAKDTKEKTKKAYRPPGYTARKAGAVVFWILFGLMLFVVGVNMVQPSSSTSQAAMPTEKEENDSVKPEALQFAENFVKEYFTWGIGDDANNGRQERLSAYLAKGIDEQAGLDVDSLEYSSKLLDSEVRKVEELGENKAYITFLVKQELSKTVEKEVEVPDPKDKKKKIKKKEKETETKQSQKYFVVPVGFEGNYGIYELPKFTFLNEGTQLEVKSETDLKPVSDNGVEQSVKDFLNTFFGSYAVDPIEKLSYVLEDPSVNSGLNGSLEFVEVKDSKVYLGKKDGQYQVNANVIFKDPESQSQFTTEYTLLVEQQGSRFTVMKLNEGN